MSKIGRYWVSQNRNVKGVPKIGTDAEQALKAIVQPRIKNGAQLSP